MLDLQKRNKNNAPISIQNTYKLQLNYSMAQKVIGVKSNTPLQFF